jgi:hypothetical protein
MTINKDFGVNSALKLAASTALNPSLTTLLRPPPTDPLVARQPDAARRLNIWEVRGASLCSIVGTCLSLSELRRIAKKCRFAEDPYQLTDYEIHGMITSQMNTDNHISRTVTKYLNAKFEGALRKSRGLEGDEAFMAYWDTAVDSGLAPGAYWALVTHPALPIAVEGRVYGEIHMMSHMCGASNRGDARAIAEAQRAKGEIARRLTSQVADRDRRIEAMSEEIQQLQNRLRAVLPLAEECERLRTALARDNSAADSRRREIELETTRIENIGLRRTGGKLQLGLAHRRARVDERQSLREWLSRDENAAQGFLAQTGDNAAEDAEGQTSNLCGRCLLYVGGRPQTVCRLRDLVARRNGCLLHHDGGLEQSQARLGELVRQADEVFFPVDCISHGAMDAVKRLCESYDKPITPLRSASVTTFLRAIDDTHLRTS